jgi:hypothetical protein
MSRPLLKLLAVFVLVSSALSLSAQDWAKAALEKSPRHREYVALKHDGRTVQAFVVYPEVSGKAPVVVMIHEIFGLSDWAKLMADELAAKGYIVIAPDLLSGAGPNGGGPTRLPARIRSPKQSPASIPVRLQPTSARLPTTARSCPPPTASSSSRDSAGAEASPLPSPRIATT